MRPMRARAAVAAALLALLPISACGDDSDESGTEPAASGSDSGWDEGAPAEWQDILTKGQEEGSVVVAGFPYLADPMGEGFEADTGIKLEFIGGDGSANSARFEQEARAGNMTIDILLGGGRELQTLLPEGLLEPVKPQMILPSVQDGPISGEAERRSGTTPTASTSSRGPATCSGGSS